MRIQLDKNLNQFVETDSTSQSLKAIEDRLAGSESAQEIVLWTQVRGEILRQNNEVESQRQLEKLQLFGKITLSLVAILAGIFLLKLGYATSGLFALGAGLFWLAPDLVKAYFDKLKLGE